MNEQIYFFSICVLCGAASGIVYDFLYVIKRFLPGKKTCIFLDVLFFVVFAGMYVFLSVLLEFPDFRPYFFFGCLVGLVLYLKSMHIILAFLINMLYNKTEKSRF